MEKEYPEIRVLACNPSLKGMASMLPDIVFASPEGIPLKMQILSPWVGEEGAGAHKFPLLVFVQGSAWTFPDVYVQIPQLSLFAQAGYVVATVTHRNSKEGHPFPACLQDVKSAIRYLRANAAQYGIDPERVAIWGSSSGGNMALLSGITGDEARYKTEDYPEVSDCVKAVVDCFGPADLDVERMSLLESDDLEFQEIFQGLRGGDRPEDWDRIREMDPKNHLVPGKSYPPFLLLHGDQDELVAYWQSERMYHVLVDHGADATMIRVEGAPHEGSFWSRELLDSIREFLDAHV